jgi:hypothetical protein
MRRLGLWCDHELKRWATFLVSGFQVYASERSFE